MVPVTGGVCVICVKTHTSRTVQVVPRHSQLSPIWYRGDGVNSGVAARRGPCVQGAED